MRPDFEGKREMLGCIVWRPWVCQGFEFACDLAIHAWHRRFGCVCWGRCFVSWMPQRWLPHLQVGKVLLDRKSSSLDRTTCRLEEAKQRPQSEVLPRLLSWFRCTCPCCLKWVRWWAGEIPEKTRRTEQNILHQEQKSLYILLPSQQKRNANCIGSYYDRCLCMYAEFARCEDIGLQLEAPIYDHM